jgi:nicotinate-nucleotide adenylyltransferase
VTARRIGLYGGTFDPVHLGHFTVAEAAMTEAALQEVVFIPAGMPPHKGGDISPFDHRLAMLELACLGREGFRVSTIEGDSARTSYTIDTLRVFIKDLSASTLVSFIIGADAFLEITTWKEYQEVLDMVDILISPRLGYDRQLIEQLLFSLGLKHKPNAKKWHIPGTDKNIQILATVPPQISSSEIKAALQNNNGLNDKGIEFTINPEVAEYIKLHGLYR